MKKKSSFGTILALGILVVIIGAVVFVYNTKMFERVVPNISLVDNNGFWNLKQPILVKIDDESGIQSYSVTIQANGQSFPVASEQFLTPQHETLVSIDAPRHVFGMKISDLALIVDATDASQWNLGSGNSVQQKFTLIVDKQRPVANITAHSYGIRHGGAALVIYQVEDDNLKEFYIETETGHRFKGQPFVEEGYYASLIAWPVMENDFRATLIAKDEAGNVAKAPVALYLKAEDYPMRKINLTESYLQGKVAQLAEDFPETQGITNHVEQFKIINKEVRAINEKRIHTITSFVPDIMIDSFDVNPMYPLKNGQVVANFGDHRYYYYEGQEVSEAWHLGLDLASVKQAPIKTQNNGEVVYADYNGIYGNMPIIHHGMGLYTLYGHCSSMDVHEGESVHDGSVIGNTGTTGSVMGDHLHFGVLVQGVDVRPQEWMDKQWIRLNVTDVMDDAKKIIARKQ